jgi:hypothetical protein
MAMIDLSSAAAIAWTLMKQQQLLLLRHSHG